MDKAKPLPRRRSPRLKDYDYSRSGIYFVTICAFEKRTIFGKVGADSISARLIRKAWEETMEQFPGVQAHHFVVMPNHVHGLVELFRADMESAPTLSEVIQTFKRLSVIRYADAVRQGLVKPFEKHLWQRSFHDHVVRDERDYQTIWAYIENNPIKWELDCFYTP